MNQNSAQSVSSGSRLILQFQRSAAFILVLLVSAAYWSVLRNDFVNYDDNVYVTGNPRVQQGLTGQNIVWAFSTTEAEFWHPFTWLSHMGDCEFYGLNPFGHHLTNLLLHLANTLLLFFALKRLTGGLWRSSVVAALFALHPLHVESVAWVAERKDLLSALFFFLALWAYARFVEERRGSIQYSVFSFQKQAGTRWYWSAVGFFLCGLMCKPMIVTLPFVLLLLDLWPLQRIKLNTEYLGRLSGDLLPLLREKALFFLLAFVGSITTFLIQHTRGNLGGVAEFPIGLRLANALVSYVRYLGKTFWPADLAVFYPYPHGWQALYVAGTAVLLVVISAIALGQVQRRAYLAVGWFWYVGTLIPVIGLVQVAHHAMADRYTYLPLIGIFIMLVWLIAETTSCWRLRQLVLAPIAAAILVACLMSTHFQLQYWRNSEELSRHALRVTSGNYVAHNNLGNVLQAAGKSEQALVHYTAALEIKTNFAAAQSNLGLLLLSEGRTNESAAHFAAAIRSEPRSAMAHFLLAELLDQQGNGPDAFAHCLEALRLRPDFPEACNELGCLFAAQNKWNEAGQLFLRATQIEPRFAEAHNNLGSALLNFGKLQEATDEFGLALRLKPDYADAQCNLGKALYYQHRGTEAAQHFAAALNANTNWVEALDLLARILGAGHDARIRNGGEAIRLANRAVELTKTNDARTLDTLAAALAETGRFAEAIASAQRAADIAGAAGQTEFAAQIRSRMKLYEAGQPLRE
jgi:tetratricopeptide (TPR) repeat protein